MIGTLVARNSGTVTEQELHERLHYLVKERNEIIAQCMLTMKNANERFDREAVRINRSLKQFEKESEPERPPNNRPTHSGTGPTVEMGFTQQEIDHYWQLKKGRK